MKKLMVALLALVAISSLAYAQQPVIGIFEDVDATFCDGTVAQYVEKDCYVYAILPPEIGAITAAEFRLDNLPMTDGLGITTPAWTTNLVIGDANTGIALAYANPQPGPLVALGTLTFFMIDALWIGDDHEVWTMPSLSSGVLAVVDDAFNTIDALGYRYTFNCTTECPCEDITATEETTWGSVKALF